MNNKLHPGLHIAIVTNPRGGYGGSLFAWETYLACKLSGIPAILATFDQDRRYPEIGSDLRRLPVPDASTPGQSGIENLGCLIPIITEARSMNKFLIIDTKTGFNISDPMFDVLEYCGLASATSSAALLPIQNGLPNYFAAVSSCKDFRDIGMSITRSLFRSWTADPNASPLIGLQTIPPIPLWKPKFLSKEALAMIHKGPSFFDQKHSLSVPDLFGYVATRTSPRCEKDPWQEVKLHVEAASRAIFNTILAPIFDSSHSP